MKKRLFKIIGLLITPLFILVFMTFLATMKIPSKLYISGEDIEVFNSYLGPLGKGNLKNDKFKVSILGVIPIKSVSVKKVSTLELMPGGYPIGVRLSSDGILVVGHSEIIVDGEKVESPAKLADIRIGDVLLTFNGEKIKSSKDLVKKVKNSKNDKIIMGILRDNEKIDKEVSLKVEKGEEYKLGLWVRDSTAGVGTMTYFHGSSGKFGALGHPITDSDTNKIFCIKEGDLLKASIISVRRGEKGNPGELRGLFIDENTSIGQITKNTECGIFGSFESLSYPSGKTYKVGFRDEIKEGKATIITTIDEEGPKEYEIEITKLLAQDVPGAKSMIIKVTDERLLDKTGGIVQGMSGSPIIQNNKIVGAVTHVLVNKPDTGYGIYIEWMLQEGGVIK